MKILGLETSCDDTAAAVVDESGILSNLVYSQLVHRDFGGVVPELASRDHLQKIVPVAKEAVVRAGISWNDIDAVAASTCPGLAGALLVGHSFGQGLAYSLGRPFIGINHVEAHVCGAILSHPWLLPPFVALVASGGHSSLFYIDEDLRFWLLGQTIDDAAGEAFDKVAKMLGLGYPGGPAVEKLASEATEPWPAFPVARLGPGSLDFSFSGLKTAVLNYCLGYGEDFLHRLKSDDIARICRGFQEAAIMALTRNAVRALDLTSCCRLAVAGGVAANNALRKRFDSLARQHGFEVAFPSKDLCTDNAAMVAWYARILAETGRAAKCQATVSSRCQWPRYQKL